MIEAINILQEIFKEHKKERICVLGTTCCGKSTLLTQMSDCVDMDEVLWPLLNKEEREYVCQTPWTPQIGEFFDKLLCERVKIEKGHPMFGTVLLDCEVLVYLDIEDELLKKHCKKRNVEFENAKRMKQSIEEEVEKYRLQSGKEIYSILLTE